MRTLGLLACAALTACSFGSPKDGDDIDANGQPDSALCFGSGLGNVCLKAPPAEPRTLEGTLDTGVDDNCTEVITVTGTDACVVAGTEVDILSTKTLRAIGGRPLVIVASSNLRIAGDLIAGSTHAVGGGSPMPAVAGPGALGAACTAGTAPENDDGGGGGGEGGSFAGIGGTGGEGDTNNNLPPAGTGAGGMPAAAFMPTTLRAGCPGATGGSATGGTAGAGGAAGGAVYLIAGVRIEISGRVAAFGAGGLPGDERGGAGGGGSGGMIGLDATDIVVSGTVTANGGGGGEGGVITNNTFPGANGTTTPTRAVGGLGGDVDGGNGGSGSGGNNGGADLAGGVGLGGAGGGGGGGGGAGYIYIKGRVMGNATFSPAPDVK